MIQQSSGWHHHRVTSSARDALEQEELRARYFWQSRATRAGARFPPLQIVDLNTLAREARRGLAKRPHGQGAP